MPERILHPQPEQGSRAEKFFEDRIEVLPVSQEEFLEMVKRKYPNKDNAEILQMKGINFDQAGLIIILLRTDIFPPEYMPYLELHEKWEAYVARKPGYNLYKKARRDYKKDNDIEIFDDEATREFFAEINVYKYDFRHELAVYKEYMQAMQDGKLDEYHNWFMQLREREKPTANETNLELIKNDTRIR